MEFNVEKPLPPKIKVGRILCNIVYELKTDIFFTCGIVEHKKGQCKKNLFAPTGKTDTDIGKNAKEQQWDVVARRPPR